MTAPERLLRFGLVLFLLFVLAVVDAKAISRVDRNLVRIASCETGYGGAPNWRHHNSTYSGGLGFLHSTWSQYKRHVRPIPRARYARDATRAQQLAVGRVLVRLYGYSPWPACSRRLGLR